MKQLDLFGLVHSVYMDSENPISNQDLYQRIVEETTITSEEMNHQQPVGQSGTPHSLIKRKIRWYQQTLKAMGIIERVDGGGKGVWQLADKQGNDLQKAKSGVKLVAFNTRLGVCIWGNNVDVYSGLDHPIALCVTSPPYPLKVARKYGNPSLEEYTDFILKSLTPIVKSLLPGGSIVINASNDIFEPGLPARSMYLEELMISIRKEFSLHLMDRIPWINRSKPPGPTRWACVKSVQLKSSYEHIYWFTNDPDLVRSDNRRVLTPHSAQHLKLIVSGGETRTAAYGDNAYKLRPGSFSGITEGSLPRNILELGHMCSDSKQIRKAALANHLPPHGAMFPTSIPDFFIRFLTEPGELVVDPFSGSGKVGLAAERLGRKWMLTEIILEYAKLSSELFKSFLDFELFPALNVDCAVKV